MAIVPQAVHAQSIPAESADHVAALHAGLQASRQWITAFNQGDANSCAELYAEDAVMTATPFGTFRGRDAIRTFWKDLVAKGARDLRYSQIKVEQPDADTLLLSAQWSMNIGGGLISRERWVQRAGQWKLAEDQFEVRYQNQ
jgi:uncharacterized protein (TIGR02246 family)